jgi:hypothetical protein
MKPPRNFITHPVDEGLLLAREDGKRLFVMNGAARFIWQLRLDGIADIQIPALMAERYAIDLGQAEQDLRSILRHWQVEGLAEASGWRRHYRIGHQRFSVDYPDQTIADAFFPILGHLELTSGLEGEVKRGFVLNLEGRRYVLRADGAELLSSEEIDEVMARLAHEAILFAFNNSDWLISTHAAAVSNGRGCALLPGVSGSGKSTLAAALLTRPHLRYLTEDLALLDRANLHVIPVPGALILKHGSWTPLEPLLGALSSQTVHHRHDQDVRYLAPAREKIAPAPAPVAVIAFPRYTPNAEASLARISTLEGLTRLIAAPSMVSPPITPQALGRLTKWAEGIPFYTLAYGSVTEAVALIEGLLPI